MYQNLILIFISVIFSYILGLTIINVVNNRMSDISINMPKVVPHINFKITKDLSGSVNICHQSDKNDSSIKESFKNHVKEEEPKIVYKLGCTSNQDCNQLHTGNICGVDNKCHCKKGSGTFCQLGRMKYKNPENMTPSELLEFKSKFRKDFTLQDYKNWLLLYQNEIKILKPHHRKNLQKLLDGKKLRKRDIPNILTVPQMTRSQYFQKMYNKNVRSKLYSDHLNGDPDLLGYNYNDYEEFIPPELLEKTWITGIVDLYNTKNDATALNHYINPPVNTGANETDIGLNYRQKQMKKQLEKEGKLDGLTEKQKVQMMDIFRN